MITDNEVYQDCLNLVKKMEFLTNPKNSNTEKSAFWKVVKTKFEKDIIDFIKKDKKSFGW